MTTRRARGDGGLHWDDKRQRWIASVTIGYDGQGKRITRRASGKTKTEAKTKLRELLRDQDDGVPTPAEGYTVADAVAYWLTYGLRGRDEASAIVWYSPAASGRRWTRTTYGVTSGRSPRPPGS